MECIVHAYMDIVCTNGVYSTCIYGYVCTNGVYSTCIYGYVCTNECIVHPYMVVFIIVIFKYIGEDRTNEGRQGG